MGHKVNPDIFRLGVSKTWIFQLKTNKNFIKNLFLFKFLRNLFMNYTTPLFDFKNPRNQKVNDKLVLRGEEQLIPSQFVKNNLLFSHVCFGSIKSKLYIESYFIDVNFKQQRKKKENVKRSHLLDVIEYKPWNSLYYKTAFISKISKNKFKKKIKLKARNKLKKIFSSRIFRFIGKKSKLYKFKSVKRLSKDIFFFLRNYNPKYNPVLHFFLNHNYKFFIKKVYKIQKNRKKKKLYLLRIFKKKKKKFIILSSYEKKYKKKKKSKLFVKRFKNFKRSYKRFRRLFFVIQKFNRQKRRIIQRKTIRNLRPKRFFNPRVNYKYKHRKNVKGYRRVTLKKLIFLVSTSYHASSAFTTIKRTIPKNPLYVYDLAISNEKLYTFYRNYKNLALLKYFLRSFKFLNFFSLKKRIFFSQNLICLLMNFLGFVSSNILTKKIYLILQTLTIFSLGFSFFNFVNFKKNYFSRFVFFKGVSKTIYRTILELTNHNKLNFNVIGQNKFRFNSSLVLNYILIKLGQYFTIHEIVNPLSFYIKSLTSISGYKILITGRLTRKERAAVMVRSGKRMPLSTIKANIDYSAGFKIMKFGLVGIKVYLLLNKSTLLNLYKFKYNYN